MNKLGRVACAAFLAVCLGCSTVIVRDEPLPVRIGDVQVSMPQVLEALLLLKGVRVQALSGAWKERAFQAQCVMKSDGKKLTIVFLAPQMRLVTITVDKPYALKCECAPHIPRAFEPERALLDLAFVNLPLDVLRCSLAPALRVEEMANGARRFVSFDGTFVAEIVPTHTDGMRKFRNAIYGYEYEICDVPLN